MVFVLYLAGLAVLIVVLALGLEFVQRRGAPAVSSPWRQAPAVGRTFEVSVLTQNSGAEPAVDIFADAAPFAVALSDAGSPSVDRSIRDSLNHCLATKPGDRTRVVYPNPAGSNDRTTLSVKRELIDWDVLYGTKILV